MPTGNPARCPGGFRNKRLIGKHMVIDIVSEITGTVTL